MKHQGIIVVLLFFIFHGFPKDNLCLFLGITTLPLKVLTLMTAAGRVPEFLCAIIKGHRCLTEPAGCSP
jgi:membrane protein YqaA with SNARE-associated domain